MVGASLPAPAPHSWPQQDTVCLDDELQLSEHREELHQNQDQEEPLGDVSDNDLIMIMITWVTGLPRMLNIPV